MTRTSFVPIVVRHARRRGLDVDALLRSHGLAPSVEHEPLAYVSTDSVLALADDVAARLGDPDLGVHLAVELTRGSYGILEFAVRSAPNLREAIERFVRYQRMLNDVVDIRMEPGDGATKIVERFSGVPQGAGKHGNEFALAAIVVIARQISGKHWAARRAWLAHPAPALDPSSSALGEFLGTERIEHGAGYNALELGDEVLELPVLSADPSLLAVMDRVAPLIAPPRIDAADIVARVREAIAASLADGQPTVAEVAARLASSARSVQRGLQARGTSFQRVLEEARRAAVMERLSETTLSLEDIAAQVGYSHVRPLLRAFRRWTGMTPAKWRRRRREGSIEGIEPDRANEPRRR